jgi:hypothetical protein
MRHFPTYLLLCSFTLLSHAQAPNTDQALLTEVRAKYDAPFTHNLQSFDCAVDFSWKDHFKETYRVGDEGTDEELEKLVQPIRNRVTVTQQTVTVSPNITEAEIEKLPYKGMAEGLLEHAVERSLYNWLPSSNNFMLPAASTPVHFDQSSSGYKLLFKMQNLDVEMSLTPNMRLQGAIAKGPQSDHFETQFVPGPNGFLLSSWTMTEDGDSSPGHRLIFSYTYQTVDGFQIPEHVSIVRESHHEVWRYTLSHCTVKTSH